MSLLRKNLPRATDVREDPRVLASTLRDVLLYLRALPEMEVRTLTSHCNLPFDISTDVTRPHIVVLEGFETQDGAAVVTPELPSWQRIPGGVRILGLDGFTAGTDYTINAFIVGGP
jgi:hypothetical protein